MISLSKVSRRYGGAFAVRDITLDIPERQFVAIVGGSGSGKTTLLKMINRLVEPDEGAVTVAGRDVRTVAAQELRRGVGYVFQGVGLFPHMTVAENIGITPRSRASILRVSLSTQVTSWPKSEKQAPETKPTYPVPIIAMRMTAP